MRILGRFALFVSLGSIGLLTALFITFDQSATAESGQYPSLTPLSMVTATPTPVRPFTTPVPTVEPVRPTNITIGDTLITSTVDQPLEEFTFEGSAGQVVDIRARFTQAEHRMRLSLFFTSTAEQLRPGSGQLGDGWSAYRLPYDGEYLIQLVTDGIVGDYTLTIVEPQHRSIEMTGALTERHDIIYYTFEAEAGDLILASAEGASFRPDVAIIGQTNSRTLTGMIFPAVSLQRTGEFQTGLIRVPESGTYYLLVHGNLSTAINPVYDFTLYFTHNPIMPLLEYGDEIKGTLTADERMQFYRFEADFGDIIDLNAYTDGDIDVYFSLYTPGISLRDDDSGPGLDPEISGLLLHDGEHVIGVGAFHAGQTGEYTLSLRRSPNRSLNDEPRIARFDKSSLVMFTFDAEADTQITLLLERLEGDHIPMLQVTNENDGRLLELGVSDFRRLSLDLEIPQTGTYVVRMERRHPYAEGTGPVIRVTVED